MKLAEFVKRELCGWGKTERVLFAFTLFFIIIISTYLNDNKIALISAICGISYTILAGKGKISCYFFGILGTFCYGFISYKNALYGNLALYIFCYFPMQVIGIYRWKKHLKPGSGEIVKTKLPHTERGLYTCAAAALSVILCFILKYFNDQSPIIDSITSVFSVIGLILTVKRCIEQWYIWFVVNFLSVIMWCRAYLSGSNCFATVLMWSVYLVLTVYFYNIWKKELNNFK